MYTSILRLASAFVAALTLMAGLVAPAVPLAQAQTNAGVDPTSGGPGTVFTFFVDGWPEAEEVDYWIIGPGSPQPFEQGTFITGAPDANGRTFWPWTASPGVWNGVWTWSARGKFSGVSATVAFTISGAGGPTVQSGVTPERGLPGTEFRFFTDGWPRGDVVDYWVLAPGRKEAYAIGRIYGDPDEQGLTHWRWKAPPEVWGGVWTMNARGFYSEVQIQIPFVIDGPPPPPAPAASVSSPQARPGDTLWFEASGFNGGEEIAWWVNPPNSTTPGDRNKTDELFANAQGVVRWQWTIPASAVSGQWSMVARGIDSGVQHQILFEVIGGASQSTTGPKLTISPSSGPPGTIFTLTVSQFRRKDSLQYWATGPDGQTTSDNQGIVTDSNGDAEWIWESPQDLAGGSWTMTVQGPKTLVTLQVPFEIIGPAAPAAPVTSGVTPTSGEPGTTFAFFAEGFASKERVGWWVTAPDGTNYTGSAADQAKENGRFDWIWTAPEGALGGEWQAVIRGKETGLERRIFFTVVNDKPAPPPPPQGSVAPDRGPAGTTFAFRAERLTPKERLAFWLESPNGVTYNGDRDVTANREGVATWEWTAPDGAARGTWTMVLQSKPGGETTGNSSVRITFTVE